VTSLFCGHLGYCSLAHKAWSSWVEVMWRASASQVIIHHQSYFPCLCCNFLQSSKVKH
jgi:hypothetical protein